MAQNIKVKVTQTKHGTKVQSPMIVHESSIFSFKTIFLMFILLGLIALTHLELQEQFVLNNIIEPLLSSGKSASEQETIELATSMNFDQRLQTEMNKVEKASLSVAEENPPVETFKPVIIPPATPTPSPVDAVKTIQDKPEPIVIASASNIVTKYHTVVSGDILYNIAKKYGVNYKDLARWNKIDNPADLKLGQKLLVSEPPKTKEPKATVVAVNDHDKDGVQDDKDFCPNTTSNEIIKGIDNFGCAIRVEEKPKPAQPIKEEEKPKPAQPAYHIVKSGDYLAKIAKQYKINYKDLARWNNIPYPYALKLEQKLLVTEPPKTEQPETAAIPEETPTIKEQKPEYHIVKSGDYLAKIAKQYKLNYKDLARWNNLPYPYALKLEQKLLVTEPPKTEEPEPEPEPLVIPEQTSSIDSDKDGVADNKDSCPNSSIEEIAKGIDAMGCVIKQEKPEYHIVQSGDYLAKIAKQYKVDYKDLARWNNIPYPYALKLGQKLSVIEPAKTEEVVAKEEKPATTHIVKSGEILFNIANQYNLNYKDLARWNNIPYPYALNVGQTLLLSEPPKLTDSDKDGIPDDKDSCFSTIEEIAKGVDEMGCVTKVEENSAQPVYHIVKRGEILARIASSYGVTYKELARWNNLPRPYNLKLGQKLLVSEPIDQDQDGIPDDKDHCSNTTIEEIAKGIDAMGCVIKTPEKISSNEPVYHTVQRGETLYKISRFYKIPYKELARWNNIPISSSLHLGQKLLVSKPIESFLNEKSVDTDGDGIDDDKDRCPNNTEEEVTIGVDEQGCAIKIDDYFDDFSFSDENKKKVSKPVVEPPVLNITKKKQFFHDRLRDGSLGPEMVWIPAGSFKMGDLQGGGEEDEQPVHEVSIKRFASSRYEITFSDYDKFATATRRKKPKDEGWGRGIRPVINVNWQDARAYCKWLSRQTGQRYRLPTEAEWEYAARAGTTTKYWWGNSIGTNNATCNKCNSQWGWDAQHMTAPVGSFKANPFGLYDTVGNVYEWTCSEYGVEVKANKKEQAKYNGKEQICVKRKTKNKFRVIRGGHWLSDPEDTRAAHRFESWLGYRVNFIGFRVVRE
jgi:formylglycine-generating enzyme required for sulfatase activity/LysM repeat protein